MIAIAFAAVALIGILTILFMAAAKHHVSPKSAFLHLFMIAMLYASVIAAITLLFQYVNLRFPDPLNDYSYVRASIYNGINWASAVLVISFPLLVYTSYVLERGFQENPKERDTAERKWLLYFTQFVTAITIIISLMTLIYNFYSGDLSVRFGLKVLVVLLVAGVTLGYYRWDLKRPNEKSRVPMIVAVVLGILLIAALVGGFFIGASPADQRKMRLDERRVSDLQGIQGQVLSHWMTKKTLPKDLAALTDSISGYQAPRDPETDVAYEYNVKGDLTFELCGTFGAKSYNFDKERAAGNVKPALTTAEYDRSVSSYPGDYFGKNWLHEEGRYCFERTIDPDQYKGVVPVSGATEPAVAPDAR